MLTGCLHPLHLRGLVINTIGPLKKKKKVFDNSDAVCECTASIK